MSDKNEAGGALSAPTSAEAQVQRIVEILQEKKAMEIMRLDLRAITDTADFFVLCSGSSDLHVKALAEELCEQLGAAGQGPWHVEGYETRRWVLLDFVDIVVHIFRPEVREFYALERLWGDAKRTSFASEEEPTTATFGQRGRAVPQS